MLFRLDFVMLLLVYSNLEFVSLRYVFVFWKQNENKQLCVIWKFTSLILLVRFILFLQLFLDISCAVLVRFDNVQLSFSEISVKKIRDLNIWLIIAIYVTNFSIVLFSSLTIYTFGWEFENCDLCVMNFSIVWFSSRCN